MVEVCPLHDNLVIKKDKSHEQTPGGILIPGNLQQPAKNEGIVLASGPGVWNDRLGKRDDMIVKDGDRVVFSQHAKVPYHYNDTDIFLISQRHVFAIIEEVPLTEEPQHI